MFLFHFAATGCVGTAVLANFVFTGDDTTAGVSQISMSRTKIYFQKTSKCSRWHEGRVSVGPCAKLSHNTAASPIPGKWAVHSTKEFDGSTTYFGHGRKDEKIDDIVDTTMAAWPKTHG